MKLKHIDTAPIGKKILLFWKNSGHFEDGTIYHDEDAGGARYHVLFDGEVLNSQPTHWCELPEEENEPYMPLMGVQCAACHKVLTGNGFSSKTRGKKCLIPNGWKLVPIEPTIEMIDAGENTFSPCYTGTSVSSPDQVWAAMIQAAPDLC